MSKHSESHYRIHSALPITVLLLLGLLFFGSYLAADYFAADKMPTYAPLLFLGAYLFMAVLAGCFFLLTEYKRRNEQVLTEALNTKMHNIFKYRVGLPYVLADDAGKIRAMNSALQKLISAEEPFNRKDPKAARDIKELCGVSLQEIIRAGINGEDIRTELGRLTMEAINAATEDIPRPLQLVVKNMEDGTVVSLANGNRYVARAYGIELYNCPHYLVTFTDVTELLDLKEKMDRDMPAVAYIDVDNLEELTQYTHVNYRDASRQVDDVLIKWASSLDGFLREYERDRYIVLFSQEALRRCETDKFSNLLDEIRKIRLGEYSIPVTVSVGISLSDTTMAERAKEAGTALDMALQRGGDQVAVRRRDGIRYYGGQTRPFQRRTKVQSRVVASYLITKISEADNLLIMGHKNPDFDSIAACVGMAQMGLLTGVPTKIIMDLNNANFKVAADRLCASRLYNDMFISAHKGLDLIRSGTLLIVVDANNFKIVESEDLANNVRQVSGKIAIIDHHRQTGEYDFDPVVNYIDPSASSAAELVTEMLEQTETDGGEGAGKLVSDEVASVILSGIMLDTNGFTRNTGSRTLDAARYLFGKGANAEYVHSFFNQEYDDYVCERSFSGCQLIEGNAVGLTWSHGTGRGADDRVAAAKEADRLLGVKGVSASFALVVVDNVVHISGRSDGSINVQLILERLGGGGRFDSAGTALSDVSLEKAVEDLKAAVRAYFAEIEESHRGV